MSIERGTILFQMGRHEAAQREFQQVLAGEPNNAIAHAMMAWCLLARKKQTEAIEQAKEAITHRPDWSGGYSALAAILSERDRLVEATEAINRAIELEPMQASYHAQLAGIRLKQRHWAAALEAAEMGLAIQPKNVVCLNVRTVSLINLGRRHEAGANIDSSLGIDPLNPITHASKGWARLHTGDHQQALEHFQESLRIDPNSQWAQYGHKAAKRNRFIASRAMARYIFFLSRLTGPWKWACVWAVLAAWYVSFFALVPWSRGSTWRCCVCVLAGYVYLLIFALTCMASPVFARTLRWGMARRFKAPVIVVGFVIAIVAVLVGLMFIPFWPVLND